MHILLCDDKTSPQPPSKGETRRKSDNALLTTMMIEHPPQPPSKGETRCKSDNALLTTMMIEHPPSPLQRGRRDAKAITLCY